MVRSIRSLLIALLLPLAGQAQLVVTNNQTPAWLVQNLLLGQGLSVSNITFNGVPATVVSEQVGEVDATNTVLGMGQGLILATGDVANALGPNNSGSSSLGGGIFGQSDPDLAILSNPQVVNDAAVLEFDFVPTGDSLKFDFVFASEEYLEFVNSVNDIFGFFLSGPGITGPFSNNSANIALIPGTTDPVTINTVNDVVNSAFYTVNGTGANGPYNGNAMYPQYDGFTVVITAQAEVICGQTYHIKIAIGDASDTAWDSAVFLKAGSFTSTGQVAPNLAAGVNVVNDTIMLEGCGLVELDFERLGDTATYDTIELVISGTATAGSDYFPPLPSQIIFQPGDTMFPVFLNIPLDADGIESLTITINQNFFCSGQQVQTVYSFYIDTPPPLGVVSNDVNGACGLSYVLTPTVTGGTGNYAFDWSTGASTPSITVSPGVTTTYYFTVSDSCSVVPVSDSIVVTMPVYAAMQITVTPDTAIQCLGNANISVTSTTGGNGVYQYQWSLSGAQVGAVATINVPAAGPAVYYVANVTDGCGFSASDSVLVSTAPLPPIVITAQSITVTCPGDTTTLTLDNVTGGNGVYTYQWTNSLNQILSSTDELEVAVPSNASYTITVADQCGHEGDTTLFTLLPIYDPFVLQLTADTTICYGEAVLLFADVSGGSGIYTIFWPELNYTDPQISVTPLVQTTYTVGILDQCGAVVSDAVTVTPEPVLVDIVVTNQGQDDWYLQAATFPICSFHMWDMGDGTMYRTPDVVHSYLDLEDHWVTLNVRTIHGCVGEDSVLIRVPAHLYFPNAFTPDGDGVNETFGWSGHYIEEFDLAVFDRWGELIYTATDIQKPWDGRVNGSGNAQTGVYVFKYRAAGHLFPAVEGYGHVTLLRGSQ